MTYVARIDGSSDPIHVVTTVIRLLADTYEVSVQGYDADPEGAVTIEVRLRVREPADPFRGP